MSGSKFVSGNLVKLETLWNPARVPATGAGHKQNPAWVPPKMAGRSHKTDQMNKTKIYKKNKKGTRKASKVNPK